MSSFKFLATFDLLRDGRNNPGNAPKLAMRTHQYILFVSARFFWHFPFAVCFFDERSPNDGRRKHSKRMEKQLKVPRGGGEIWATVLGATEGLVALVGRLRRGSCFVIHLIDHGPVADDLHDFRLLRSWGVFRPFDTPKVTVLYRADENPNGFVWNCFVLTSLPFCPLFAFSRDCFCGLRP